MLYMCKLNVQFGPKGANKNRVNELNKKNYSDFQSNKTFGGG